MIHALIILERGEVLIRMCHCKLGYEWRRGFGSRFLWHRLGV